MLSATHGRQTSAVLHQHLPHLEAYDKDAKATISAHVLAAIAKYPSLTVAMVHAPPDGSLAQTAPSGQPATPLGGGGYVPLLALSGTLPISIQGTQYFIPVSVRLPQGYPCVPPACWVTPTPGMVLNACHRLVSDKGRFLGAAAAHEWGGGTGGGSGGGGLLPVLAQMVAAFQEAAPVYALAPDAAATSASHPWPAGASSAQASQAVVSPPSEEQVAKAIERVDALVSQSRQLAQAEEDAERQYNEGDEALEAGKIDLAAWVKAIRSAAREQFMSRALLAKVAPAKSAAEETLAVLLKARQVYEDHKKAVALAEEQRREEESRRQERQKREEQAQEEELKRQQQQERLARERYQEMQQQQHQQQQPQQYWPPGMPVPASLPFGAPLHEPRLPAYPAMSSNFYPSDQPPPPLPFMAPPPGAFGAVEPPDLYERLQAPQDPYQIYPPSYPYPSPPLDIAGNPAPFAVGATYPPRAAYPAPPLLPPNYYQPY